MKKSNNILFIGGVLMIGVISIAAILSAGSSATPAAAETQSQIIQIGMPPMPSAPGSTFATSNPVKPSTIGGLKNAEPIKITDICTESQAGDFDCYQSYYQKLVKAKGITAAFDDLKARYPKDTYVQSQCHPLTHVIGRAGAESFSKVSQAYKYGDTFCASGYYHGVLESFAHRIGVDNLKRDMDTVCAELHADGRYSLDYYNCVHGLGHGVMAVADDNLFRSLDYCDGLSGSWEQNSCGSGVFMENIIADGINHQTKFLDPKKPLYPCTASPEKYKDSCYLLQSSYMLKINHDDFAKTFEWCEQSGRYEATCDQSLGRDASGRSLANGPKSKDICMLGNNTFEVTNCAIGAAKDIIYYFHSDKPGLAFCNLFDDPVKTSCINAAEPFFKSF